MSNPPFILVDGSSYLFRAYHALPPLTNSKGQSTGAIIGVINMLRKLIKTYQPIYMAVVFDAKGKTFRHDLYPDYKANRPKMPDDLAEQIEPLHQIVKALGLPLIIVPDVEADDVIGTLAYQAAQKGWTTLISTGDKDMAQLVNAKTTLINTMNDQILDQQGVFDKFKVHPEQIIDYLALMGDSADNIPGVFKCGPKTAAKWLAEYQTMEQVIAQADKIKGKVGENLRAHLDFLPLGKQLTTIKCQLDLAQSLEDLKITDSDQTQLKTYYENIESSRLLATLDENKKADKAIVETIATDYHCITDKKTFEQWLDDLKKAKCFAFDTETTSLNAINAELVGLSFSIEAGRAAYCPVAHTDVEIIEQLDRDWVLAQIKPLLEDKSIAKIGQHLKYDKNILANYAIDLQGIAEDTMLESYVFNATASRHNLDALAKKYLKIQTTKFEDIAGKGKKQLTFDQIGLEIATAYAAEDADITLRLHQYFSPKIKEIPRLQALYRDVEIPLIPVLAKMEQTGIVLNAQMLQTQSQDLASQVLALEIEAHEIAGRVFNLSSPKQIGEIFFDTLDYPVISKTPKGKPSTSESVLQKLAEQDYALAKVILSHRTLIKLKSTYTDKLPQLVSEKTGRLHTSYHQAVTATGRLSSSDPNLQNIPIKTAEGRKIRQAFIAQKDWKILAADYSQIELRIMAHLSAEPNLITAFKQGLDIHQATAAEVFAVDNLQKVTKEQRRAAKAVNFGLIYGMSAFGLSNQLNIERDKAQAYIDLYFERYPKVQDYMKETRELARKQGFVETVFGRRLYLPEINSNNFQKRTGAERTAINAPMQGTAADIIKKSMIDIDHWLNEKERNIQMLLQVHDELVFEVHPDQIDEATQQIKKQMEQAVQLDIPLIVEIGVGNNWDEAH